MVEALFFSHTNIDRSCVQPGSENTMCPLYTENADSVSYGLLSMISLIFTLFSCNGTVWESLFIYKNCIQLKGASKILFLCGVDWLSYKKKEKKSCQNIFISHFRPSADTHPEQLIMSVRKQRTFGVLVAVPGTVKLSSIMMSSPGRGRRSEA